MPGLLALCAHIGAIDGTKEKSNNLNQEQPEDLPLFGESPSHGRKRRSDKKSGGKKKASAPPVESADFMDHFEEIGLEGRKQ